MQSNNPSLAAVWWPGTRHNHISRAVLLAVCGSLLLTFSAKFSVPYWPVPMTMQTFVCVDFGHALRLASCHRRGAVIFG